VHWQAQAQQLAQAFQGPTVLAKGPTDVICDGTTRLECAQAAALKRSGGQGDVLTGGPAVGAGGGGQQAVLEGPGGQGVVLTLAPGGGGGGANPAR